MSLPHREMIEEQRRYSILMENSGLSNQIPLVGGGGGSGSIFDIPKPYLDMLAAQDSVGASLYDLKTSQEGLITPAETFYAKGASSFISPSSDGGKEYKKQLKAKKGNLKKQGEPIYAFLTKTNVNCLDDGYKWRKYGQKAVKQNHFQRSYYRCTSESVCRVKKTTERSLEDPSMLVTTYKGTHTHPCPMIRPEIMSDAFNNCSQASVRCASSVCSPQVYLHQPTQLPFYNQTGSSSLNLTNNNTANDVSSSFSYPPEEGQDSPSLLFDFHADHGLPQDSSNSYLLQERYFPSLQYSMHREYEHLQDISYTNQLQGGQHYPSPLQCFMQEEPGILQNTLNFQERQFSPSPLPDFVGREPGNVQDTSYTSLFQERQFSYSPLPDYVHREPGNLQETSYTSLFQEGRFSPSPLPDYMHREPGNLQDTSYVSLFQEGQYSHSPLPYPEHRDHGILQDMTTPFQAMNEGPSDGSLGNLPRVSF